MTKFAQRGLIRNWFSPWSQCRVYFCIASYHRGYLPLLDQSDWTRFEADTVSAFPISIGGWPCLPFRCIVLVYIYQLIPKNDFIHNFRKFFPPVFLLPKAVFHIGECFLVHCQHHISLLTLWYHLTSLYGSPNLNKRLRNTVISMFQAGPSQQDRIVPLLYQLFIVGSASIIVDFMTTPFPSSEFLPVTSPTHRNCIHMLFCRNMDVWSLFIHPVAWWNPTAP